MEWKRYVYWLFPIVPAIAIKIFSFFPDAVEKYYSNGFYPVVARLMRFLYGWIAFSVGDILYFIMLIFLIASVYAFFKRLIRKEMNAGYLRKIVDRFLYVVLWIYVIFNAAWGLNYNRRGISYQLQLNVQPYSADDLATLLKGIVFKLNMLDSVAHANRHELQSKPFLFATSVSAYQNLSAQENVFDYRTPSVKPSLFNYFANYFGFSGYYNPFTGEAQVNTSVPLYVQPFTSCHEMGHQLGYAKEGEANFAGYLSAKSSPDPVFRYSVYFDLYLYAASELYVRDSALFLPIRGALSPSVRADVKDLRNFYAQYENPFEPLVRRMYGRYLKANDQPKGLLAYDEVIARVMAYYKKNGMKSL